MKYSEHLDSLVIISGMSGSGKHTVFKALEDLGYFCVDNIPPTLVPRLLQMSDVSGGRLRKLAVVVDARLGESVDGLKVLHRQLSEVPFRSNLVFVDASDEVLARRFSETRRVHPLAQDRTLLDGIRAERAQLAGIRALADLVVDTSEFSVHDLKRFVQDYFHQPGEDESLRVSIVSFGFKYGLPFNADLVFDVRFLPNPHFVPELKPLTGNDEPVARYMDSQAETREILGKIEDILVYLLPKYSREGKTYLTVAVGCTGGRHRSVLMANRIAEVLRRDGYAPTIVHRDLHREE